MSGRGRTEPPHDEPGTLGALLYADRGKARIPESEWVALVRGIAGGDELALHALYERAHRLVFTLIMRIVHDRHSAEELTLDVFHDVWRRAASYDGADGTVIGWILNQARSRAIDRLRFEQRKKRVGPAGAVEADAADSDAALELREQSELLAAALAGLSADERVAIETTFFGGLTHAEAAEHLDRPLGTVKTHIRSGLGKLRRALAHEESDG